MRYLSLFSGIDAASVAWQPLGWQPVAFAEIEPFPCAVLARHYPEVPNLGDVAAITAEQIAALGPVDVVVGGSPCQDLSCAGKRAGLAGARSSLFHEQIRIFHAARHFCSTRWLVWENVPGAFSSNRGRDFACVVNTLAGCRLNVPADGWATEGVALGEHGLLEWSVLDARWFGLAQRRKRIFAVLDIGDWENRPPVLLECDSLRGDTAPGRAARENIAPTLAARTRGGGGLGTDFELDGGLIPAYAIQAGALRTNPDSGPDGTGVQSDVAYTLEARAEVQCVAAIAHGQGGAETTTGQHSPTLTCNHEAPIIAFQCHGGSVGEMGTLRATGDVQSGVPFTLAVHGSQDPDTLTEYAHTLGRNHGQENAIYTLAERGRDGGQTLEYRSDGTSNALLTPNGGRAGIGIGAIASSASVRRLTPRECERLQGFSDDYTRIAWRGKPAESCPDGPRYRALGNSMAVPVMRWIGQQIDTATRASTNESSRTGRSA